VKLTIRPSFVHLLLFVFVCTYALATESGRTFTPSEYASQLDRLSSLADSLDNDPHVADVAISDLRGNWKVQTEGHEFVVDTGWLIDRFRKGVSDNTARDDLKRRLNDLKAEAQAFQEPFPDSASTRTKLDQILARSEFHQVHGPSWWDRLKYRVLEWISRILSRSFGSSAAPTAGRVLVWSLVGVAVLTLAYFVYRQIRQNARQESMIPNVVPVSAKGWRVWMAEAQAAAANGLWREAVHLAYWAGISFLEERSAWRPDKARTPREYLRLLPAESEHRSTLSALTRKLEVTWYGNDPAGPETFSETVALLETIGCRV